MKTIFQYSFDKSDNLVEICSWVLMDNHFHILVFVPEEFKAENISKFLSRLSAAYLKYFNEKHRRTGNLFEGRFQCIPVEDDYYLKHLFSYIHLNPLKMLDPNWKQTGLKIPKAKIYLEDYKFSSFHDLIMQKNRYEKNILTTNQKVLEISKRANNLEKLFSNLSCSSTSMNIEHSFSIINKQFHQLKAILMKS